jgi:hypothetical protein
MDSATRQLIEAIHRSSCQLVVAVTGGGTGAIAQLLAVPGGSRTILEAVVPYGEQGLIDFLGHRPAQFCSANTNRAMAARAYDRANWLTLRSSTDSLRKIIGVSCTASLVTDRPKSGDHRFYVTIQSAEGGVTYSLILQKGARDREGEEAVLDSVVLNGLAEFLSLEGRVIPALLSGEELQKERLPTNSPLENFLQGKLATVCVAIDGQIGVEARRPAVLVPGAFNPVHQGHWSLAAVAERLSGGTAAFELSVTNVDKPPLEPDEIGRRLNQFSWRSPVWLTRSPTFAEKAKLFPGVTFAIGADTAERIVSSRYYKDNQTQMAEALEFIWKQGCRFLVACRYDEVKGRFVGLADLVIPAGFKDLFTDIPETEFGIAISSTQLRQQGRSTTV